MDIKEIIDLVKGEIKEGQEHLHREIGQAFASDLMSDVLTINADSSLMLVTGLANIQTIRTCEMAEIKTILFVRGKKASDEMVELANENEMVLIETDFSMYRTSGLLFGSGILPVY